MVKNKLHIYISIFTFACLLLSECDIKSQVAVFKYQKANTIWEINLPGLAHWCSRTTIETVSLVANSDTVFQDTVKTYLIEKLRCMLSDKNICGDLGEADENNIEKLLGLAKISTVLRDFERSDKLNYFLNKNNLVKDGLLKTSDSSFAKLLIDIEFNKSCIEHNRCFSSKSEKWQHLKEKYTSQKHYLVDQMESNPNAGYIDGLSWLIYKQNQSFFNGGIDTTSLYLVLENRVMDSLNYDYTFSELIIGYKIIPSNNNSIILEKRLVNPYGLLYRLAFE
jgi:hypothetical protein